MANAILVALDWQTARAQTTTSPTVAHLQNFEWKNRRMKKNKYIDEWTNERTNEREQRIEQMDGWMQGRMNSWVNEWENEWNGEHIIWC